MNVDIGQLLLLIAQVVLGAAVGEGVIEFIPKPLLNLVVANTEENKQIRTVVLNCLSGLLGVGIALNFQLGLFALLGAGGQLAVVDLVLTGILAGRGSNYIHELIKKFVLERNKG